MNDRFRQIIHELECDLDEARESARLANVRLEYADKIAIGLMTRGREARKLLRAALADNDDTWREYVNAALETLVACYVRDDDAT